MTQPHTPTAPATTAPATTAPATTAPATTHPAAEAVARAQRGEVTLGYWNVLDCPVSAERLALVGYDYVCLDAQHGLIGPSGLLANLIAVEAAHGPAGVVRVRANDPAEIGQALDFGARGVIVPLVDDAAQAEAAVRAARYPGRGVRSYGPMRSGLRVGPRPEEANASVLVLVMIETPQGLADVADIVAVDGIDGVYIGPSDLGLSVGARYPGDPDAEEALEEAVVRVREAARAAGKIAGIHTPSGGVARQRVQQGFTFVSVASDVVHLETAARDHLSTARG